MSKRRRSKLHLSLLLLAVIVTTSFMVGWVSRALETNGGYLFQNIHVFLTGTETLGEISKVAAHLDPIGRGNYTATVTYEVSGQAPVTRDFRYGERLVLNDAKVRVAYNAANPLEAALIDDAGYFKYNCYGLIFFGLFFVLIFGLIYWVDSKFKKKTV